MFHVHATELYDTQQFLVDFGSRTFGKHLRLVGLMHGLTKKPNYEPEFSDHLKTDLKVASDPGLKLYAIVIPIRKNADW